MVVQIRCYVWMYPWKCFPIKSAFELWPPYSTSPPPILWRHHLLCWTNGGGRDWTFPSCCCFYLQHCLSQNLYFIISKHQIGIYFNMFPNSQAQSLSKFCSHKIFFFPPCKYQTVDFLRLYNSMTQFVIINLCLCLFSSAVCYILYFCLYMHI